MNKEGKNFKIWGVRFALAGDMVFSLPILNYLELLYPNSFKYWAISPKCSQFAPIFFNHPLINQIRITESSEGLGPKDVEIAESSDLIINVAPHHPDGMPGTTEKSCWWNYYTVYEESFRMADFDVKNYRQMPEELRYPRLERWFAIENYNNTIGIWGFSSYGLNKRSPSIEKWTEIIKNLLCKGYTIFQFGGENDPHFDIPEFYDKIFRFNNLEIFSQIKKSLGCQVNIHTNSGIGAILGGYGAKQITLLTNDAPYHTQNLTAFAPLNYKNNNINLTSLGGFDNLAHEDVLEAINKLK